MANAAKTKKRIHDMTDEELKQLRWSESVIGTRQVCLIVDVRGEDGTVVAIPVDEEERQKASQEVRAIAIQKFRSIR